MVQTTVPEALTTCALCHGWRSQRAWEACAKEGPLDRQPAGNPVSYAALVVTVRGEAEGMHPSFKALTRTGTGGSSYRAASVGGTCLVVGLPLFQSALPLETADLGCTHSRRPQDTAVPQRWVSCAASTFTDWIPRVSCYPGISASPRRENPRLLPKRGRQADDQARLMLDLGPRTLVGSSPRKQEASPALC